MANLPYATVTGTLETMLEKIKTASVPERFSQDYVSTKLSMKGGSARSVIPFIKKMGLVGSDGVPTERYKEFRNPEKSGQAIANAMKEVYEKLFEMNEYANDLDNSKLKGLIVEATGAEITSAAVTKTLSTFNALKNLADFKANNNHDVIESVEPISEPTAALAVPSYSSQAQTASGKEGINLSYTINLNLPATTDIAVFNAIFKSLEQHLLQD